MAKKLSEIESDALQLSIKERARLIRRLIISLESENDGDVEQLWLDEAEMRLAAYRNGETSTRPGEEVFEAILNRT
jgi:putative addiction module component (TIGR02574 family)